MNTAELREMARQAEKKLHWKIAADLYRQAWQVYPPHHPKSELAIKDKANLLERAESCERFAASNF